MHDYLHDLGLVTLGLSLGMLFGHAVGYARARALRPRYRRTESYEVRSPGGLFIHTPSLESAKRFADEHGGTVTRSR